jgi:hypothetical protein
MAEDYVIFKALATRDRDIEDAASVLRRAAALRVGLAGHPRGTGHIAHYRTSTARFSLLSAEPVKGAR